MRDPAFLCDRCCTADFRQWLIHSEQAGFPMRSLVEIIRENFDLRPAGIIKMLDLRRPIYKQTAAYGHFGSDDLDLPWEKLDKVDALKAYL